MKPTALLTLLAVFLSTSLLAQQTPPYPEPKPAPQLGHPLDPADVDVLTGKTAQPQRNYVAPYVQVSPYGAYATSGAMPGRFVHHRFVQPVHPAFFVTGKTGFFAAAPLRVPVFFPLAGHHGGVVVVIRP